MDWHTDTVHMWNQCDDQLWTDVTVFWFPSQYLGETDHDNRLSKQVLTLEKTIAQQETVIIDISLLFKEM